MKASCDGLDALLGRTAKLENRENRRALDQFLYEEINDVKPSTLSARLDGILVLGHDLGERPWKHATREDVIRVISEHRFVKGAYLGRPGKPDKGRPLAASTKYQWKVHIQVFYKWLLKTDESPPQFRRLPFRKKETSQARLRELTLSPQEIKQLLGGARNARDRCIIVVAVETGFRASEMAALRLDYMETRNHGYWFDLPPDAPNLKTGPRDVSVPVIAGAPLLEKWIHEHPRRHAKAAPLFVTLSNRSFGRPMTGKTISEAVSRCAKRAGMRHVWCHLLRHASASLKVAKHMNPEAIRLVHGWSRRSNMLGHYTHAESQFERMVLDVHGLEHDQPELLDVIGSLPCLLCGGPMHIGDDVCPACGVQASDVVANSTAHRQRNHVISYVALDLARARGGIIPDEREDGLIAAIAQLEKEYQRATGSKAIGDEFVRWCLMEWVNVLQEMHRGVQGPWMEEEA